MATEMYCALPYFNPGGVRCAAKGDPPAPVPQPFHTHHKVFQNSTHATLQAVLGAEPLCSPTAPIRVSVLNGSDGRLVRMDLKRSDTVETLKKMFLQERGTPDLTSKLNLACNGKPALDHQTLAELQLNETAMFVTYQKCIGG
ncbi:hypothetical protein AGOR_G00191930 [Albula goreensis]|uniref:Ubiquitin-like domain-containing protein n=1 Tax=Albula goreensis TaxID=1534307 RepID=A0A8T3CTB0_9TELE|nr:hypothetical protein AGOR_G00191930 [Albula goreensis]